MFPHSLGLGVEQFASLLHTSLQEAEVLHNVLDVVDGKVDEHTGDLGGFGWSHDLLDVLEEDGTDLLFVSGVLWHDGVDQVSASKQVSLLQAQLLVDLKRL